MGKLGRRSIKVVQKMGHAISGPKIFGGLRSRNELLNQLHKDAPRAKAERTFCQDTQVLHEIEREADSPLQR